MPKRPTLFTERLILRPFALSDADTVQRLAGERDIASTTRNIPHPYEPGMAAQWIATHQAQFDAGSGVTFAVVRRTDNLLMGSIGLAIRAGDDRAEMGYWLGKPFWNQGYTSEAAQAVIRYGFDVLGLNRIEATHLTRNPASGRVMQKAGMMYEGTLRQYVKKWGVYEDLTWYGILRSEHH